MKRFLKGICLVAGWVLGLTALALISLSSTDHLDLLDPDFFFYGIDFLPATWLLALIVPTLMLFAVARRGRTAYIFASIFGIYLVCFGDFSYTPLTHAFAKGVAVREITVATLNVRYYSYGLDEVIGALRAMHADIMLLSENSFQEGQEKIFRERMAPMSLVAGHDNSTAILTRFPILSFKEVEMPSFEASLSGGNNIEEQHLHPHRSFVHALLDVNGTPLHAISVRFIAGRPKDKSIEENIRWGKYLLETQLAESAFFAHYVTRLDGPVIFGGDLNAPPGSKVLRRLSGIATDAFLDHHLAGEMTFRTELPTLRLDYIFYRGDITSVSSERLLYVVSDHFPVISRFSMKPASPLAAAK